MPVTTRFILAASLMFLPAAAICHTAGGATSPTQDDGVATEAFVEWAKRHAIPVENWQMNAELEAYLDRALAGKRIIFIGEPGHFFSEKYDVQLMLIRHLMQKGYRHLFVEGLGATMAPAVDHFVVTGETPGEGEAEGEEKPADQYRRRTLAGFVSADTPEFRKRQKAAQNRFYRALHAMNESLDDGEAPLRIHPLDLDMAPGGCYHSIAEVLAAHADDPALEDVRQLAKKVEGETAQEEIERLERLRDLVRDDHEGRLGGMTATERADLRRYTDCLVETLVFFETARADGRLNRALVRREPAMFRQVQYAMDSLPPDAKMIMIAHNNHLCRIGADTSRARQPSVGEMIDQAHPGEVFSIWMLHDHGWLLNPMAPEPLEELKSDPMRVESLLVKAGSTYVLPLGTGEAGEQYLAQQRRYSYFSWFETGTLTKQTDAIFFIDEIMPLQED